MNNNHHLHSSLCKEIKEILISNEQKKLFNQKKLNKSSSMKNITKSNKTRNRNNSSLIIANNTTSCSMYNNNNNNSSSSNTGIQNFAKLLLNQKPYDNVLLSTYYNCRNNNSNNVLMHMSYNNNNNNNNSASAKVKHKNRSFLEHVDNDEQYKQHYHHNHQKNFIARILNGYGSSTGKTQSNVIHNSHKKNKSNNSSCNISNSMKYSNFLNTTREYTHKGSKSKLKEDLINEQHDKDEFVSKKYKLKRKDKLKRINSCENEMNKINNNSHNHTHRKNSCYNNCTSSYYHDCSSVSSRNNHKKQFTHQCLQNQMNNSHYNSYQTNTNNNNNNNNVSKRIISSTSSSDKMKSINNEFDWGALQSLEEYHFMFVKLITKQKKDLKQCDNCINNSTNTNLNINEFD